MSTLYTINAETSTTVSATDQFPIYKSSTGRVMKASGSALRTYLQGASSSETLGFYGATPTSQLSSTSQAVAMSTAAVSAAGSPWGYATSAQADGIVRLVNRLRADLVTVGLITGS